MNSNPEARQPRYRGLVAGTGVFWIMQGHLSNRLIAYTRAGEDEKGLFLNAQWSSGNVPALDPVPKEI
jgi:hypothetical protein